MRVFNNKLWLIIILMIFAGCRKDQWNDCFQGTGKEETLTLNLEPFTKLLVGDKFDVYLIQDTSQPEQAKITGGKNIIGQIITRVKDGQLTIENKNTCNFVRSYDRKIKIEIRVKFLNDIEIFSATNLTSLDTLHFEKSNYLKLKNYGLGNINLKLKLGFLDVQSTNSGNIFLEGFSNILTCSIEEVTQLDARKLACHDCYMASHTALDCFVNPEKVLFAHLFNSGNVYYVSEPSDKKEVTIKKGVKGQLLIL
ncbi:MAG: head GIN domain-containing protein [Bacteroidia bacterium]